MHITIDIKNEKIAEHVLWVLERFKKDGVKIKLLDDSIDRKKTDKPAFTDEYVEKNWRTLVSQGLKNYDEVYYKSDQYKLDRGEYLMSKNK